MASRVAQRPALACGSVLLNDGCHHPRIGYGTYKVGVIPASATSAGGLQGTGGCEDCATVVGAALRLGYRFLDCAAFYENEAGVGAAVAASGIPRSELFLCSKVWNTTIWEGPAAVKKQVYKSLGDLQTDYLDLCLVHWPVPGKHVAAYAALQALQQEGVVRSIGVSNYTVEDVEELMGDSSVVVTPAVNQIELNPFLYRKHTLSYMRAKGIVVQAYRPLNNGSSFKHPTLRAVAEKHGKTVAQVLGAWCLAKNAIYIPKSVREERMLENAGVLDLELDEVDMATLDGLTEGPATFAAFEKKYRQCVVRDTPLVGAEENGVKAQVTTN